MMIAGYFALWFWSLGRVSLGSWFLDTIMIPLSNDFQFIHYTSQSFFQCPNILSLALYDINPHRPLIFAPISSITMSSSALSTRDSSFLATLSLSFCLAS